MALFNFNDEKSRKQINHAIIHANNTKQANADNLVRYVCKKARLVGSRDEWEITNLEKKNEVY